MKLTQRERIFIGIGGVFLLGLGLVFGVRYVKDRVLNMDEELAQIELERSEIDRMGREYRALKDYEKPKLDENLVQFIEVELSRLNLTEKANVRPSEIGVKKKFLKKMVSITIRQMTAFPVLDLVRTIEQQKASVFKIESFSARKAGRKQGLYTFSLKVASYGKK